jgi:hypothetical protein
MALPPSVQAAIDEVRAVINAGRPFLNGAFIDAVAFFTGTANLKKSLPEVWEQMAAAERNEKRSLDSLTLIDELEMLVENGKAHVFGKVWVDHQSCLQQLKNVEDSLTQDLARAQTWSASPPTPATTDVQAAQTEAERIIAEAKLEAERIKEDARRQSGSPWSS